MMSYSVSSYCALLSRCLTTNVQSQSCQAVAARSLVAAKTPTLGSPAILRDNVPRNRSGHYGQASTFTRDFR
jgi:hypothetical protein